MSRAWYNPISMKCYIAGPITGYDREERRRAFAEAARLVEQAGMEPINPLDEQPRDVSPGDPGYWAAAMRIDLRRLLDPECGAILLLDGWQASRGASLERLVAEAIGLTILSMSDLLERVSSR
jgi:hypothetical protein